MRRYLRPSAVNDPVSAWGLYKSDDDQTHSDDLCGLAAGAAGTSLALAQGYPQPPGSVYSTAPAPYPPGGYVVDDRRGPGAPDFDALDDDEAPNGQWLDRAVAARPAAGMYSDRGAPQGPILSPNDPRYGRPMAPVYSDRGVPHRSDPFAQRSALRPSRRAAAGDLFRPSSRPAAASLFGSRRHDNRIPGSGFIYPSDDNRGLRPPEAVGAPTRRHRNGRSLRWAPTAGRWCCRRCRRKNSRKSVPRNCRRTCAGRKSPSPPRSRRER